MEETMFQPRTTSWWEYIPTDLQQQTHEINAYNPPLDVGWIWLGGFLFWKLIYSEDTTPKSEVTFFNAVVWLLKKSLLFF